MPLDHFVSQVHLKRFYSPLLGNRLYAIRKRTLFEFTPTAKDICRLPDGNTNPFLKEQRAVEDFLKLVEPRYNKAVANLLSETVDHESMLTITRFIAYVTSCAPAAMRTDSASLRAMVKATGVVLDAKGRLPKPPPELGASSFTELVERGDVGIEIDPQYPQAISIAQISTSVLGFANFRCEIIRNGFADSPFFTSDFPVAIEQTSHPEIVNRIVPLAPEVAIRLRPDPKLRYSEELFDPLFTHRRVKRYAASWEEVVEINKLIVRCAESEVYFRDNLPWVLPFVKKNKDFKIENVTTEKRTSKGVALFSMKKVLETRNGG